ncbi:MAG: GNAT family protein, partial [Anaerolineales bacterium]
AARFAIETLGLARVEIVAAAENVASQRVAQKAGAHYEGRHPKQMVVHTDSHDAVLYSLTPADFAQS